MKIALVWPYGNDITCSIPLGLGYLVANMKDPAHEIRIFDGTIAELLSYSPALILRRIMYLVLDAFSALANRHGPSLFPCIRLAKA